jgi:hypothetical protein
LIDLLFFVAPDVTVSSLSRSAACTNSIDATVASSLVIRLPVLRLVALMMAPCCRRYDLACFRIHCPAFLAECAVALDHPKISLSSFLMSMLTQVVSFDQVVTMTDAFLASVALLESKIVGVNDCVFL